MATARFIATTGEGIIVMSPSYKVAIIVQSVCSASLASACTAAIAA